VILALAPVAKELVGLVRDLLPKPAPPVTAPTAVIVVVPK
jgi:hypothetical protein